MELVLKNTEKITIDSMNNRQNLNEKDENRMITFSIYNADPSASFDDMLNKIKNNNIDFSLSYGSGHKLTFPGWILSDIAEEIDNEQRKIVLMATRQ